MKGNLSFLLLNPCEIEQLNIVFNTLKTGSVILLWKDVCLKKNLHCFYFNQECYKINIKGLYTLRGFVACSTIYFKSLKVDENQRFLTFKKFWKRLE